MAQERKNSVSVLTEVITYLLSFCFCENGGRTKQVIILSGELTFKQGQEQDVFTSGIYVSVALDLAAKVADVIHVVRGNSFCHVAE